MPSAVHEIYVFINVEKHRFNVIRKFASCYTGSDVKRL